MPLKHGGTIAKEGETRASKIPDTCEQCEDVQFSFCSDDAKQRERKKERIEGVKLWEEKEGRAVPPISLPRQPTGTCGMAAAEAWPPEGRWLKRAGRQGKLPSHMPSPPSPHTRSSSSSSSSPHLHRQ
ncbi:unnamed protein product [Pleuronectes platessa]|uniref:Uncharacterized protein n=1 Tax=Pleuronectes platessa TaxID=8262 RepID=A0A9N7UNB7_PLEPL|nr:unnamed protein product [Pleuronectes platessa]